MKQTTNIILTGSALLALVFTACDSPSKKVEHAKVDLMEAKEELNTSIRDSIADYEAFKAESENRINNNEKIIEAFKERMKTDRKQIRNEDQKMIDELEQRNINMRLKIEEYKKEGKDDWKAFKTSFNHEMDDLSAAIAHIKLSNAK